MLLFVLAHLIFTAPLWANALLFIPIYQWRNQAGRGSLEVIIYCQTDETGIWLKIKHYLQNAQNRRTQKCLIYIVPFLDTRCSWFREKNVGFFSISPPGPNTFSEIRKFKKIKIKLFYKVLEADYLTSCEWKYTKHIAESQHFSRIWAIKENKDNYRVK